MDSTFSWSPNVSELSRKIFCAIGRLRKCKNLLPLKIKLSLSHTLLLPILDYANSRYLDVSQQLFGKLKRMQNLIIRCIFGLRQHNHVLQYRSQLKWLSIKHRRYLHSLTLLYTILFHPVTAPQATFQVSGVGNLTLPNPSFP